MNDIIKQWLNDNIDELIEMFNDCIYIDYEINNNKFEIKRKGIEASKVENRLKQKGWLSVDALEKARAFYDKNWQNENGEKTKDLYEKAIKQLQDEINDLKEILNIENETKKKKKKCEGCLNEILL